jgi:hypothetical protein
MGAASRGAKEGAEGGSGEGGAREEASLRARADGSAGPNWLDTTPALLRELRNRYECSMRLMTK